MQKFAIFEGALSPNQNNRVAEVIDAVVTVEGVEHKLTDRYHPAVIATMRRCPADTLPGHTYDILTDTYTDPAVFVAVVESDSGNGEPPPR